MWPSPVDLKNLGDGPNEDDIPVLPELEAGSAWDPEATVNTFRWVVSAEQIVACMREGGRKAPYGHPLILNICLTFCCCHCCRDFPYDYATLGACCDNVRDKGFPSRQKALQPLLRLH